MKKASILILMFCISVLCVFGQKTGSGKERVSVTEENVTTTMTVTESEPQAYNTEFHISLATPTDDAADDDVGAGTGFSAGFTFYKPIRSVKNLSFLWGFDILYNPTSSDYKEDIEEGLSNDIDITYSAYLNAPIKFGLGYAYPVTPAVSIFGEAALGGNLSYITPFKVEAGGYESKISFAPAFGFYYGAKFGVLFSGKYSLGVSFNNLGTYKYEITSEDPDGDETEYKTDKLSIGSTMFSVGIRF
jgi:hypothetical protein